MSFSSIFEEKVFWIPDKVLYNPMDQTLQSVMTAGNVILIKKVDRTLARDIKN